jgi:hypothetical protein
MEEEDDDVIVLVDPGIDIGRARLFEETKLKKTKTNLVVVVRNHREEEEEKKQPPRTKRRRLMKTRNETNDQSALYAWNIGCARKK